jgi:hypothetical protein
MASSAKTNLEEAVPRSVTSVAVSSLSSPDPRLHLLAPRQLISRLVDALR